ncbi:MAG: hypothetical protein NZ891_07690 [bacterium]|nr:hypothetical protein [bacterium]MDW8164601.1 hypothetical protein [Candidatus Omnitrophota bacterium]
MNNLRQIFLALSMYVQDYDDFFVYTFPGGYDTGGLLWNYNTYYPLGLLLQGYSITGKGKYIEKPDVLVCVSRKIGPGQIKVTVSHIKSGFEKQNRYAYSTYVLNPMIYSNIWWVPVSLQPRGKFSRASRIGLIAICDGVNLASDLYAVIPHPEKTKTIHPYDGRARFYPEGINVVFFSGGAKWFPNRIRTTGYRYFDYDPTGGSLQNTYKFTTATGSGTYSVFYFWGQWTDRTIP